MITQTNCEKILKETHTGMPKRYGREALWRRLKLEKEKYTYDYYERGNYKFKGKRLMYKIASLC